MLPENERDDHSFLELLEARSLGYLCPYLKLRVDLVNKLSSSSLNPKEFSSFVEIQSENYDRKSQSFVQTLVSCIYETAINQSRSLTKPDKTMLNQEKQMIESHRECLQNFVKTIEQQIWAIYALQLIGYKNNFPKDLLLRLFVHSYDLDIIEEDAYFKWKEDLNDDIPGKGKALFQVSKWLQWLEHASEESDEEEQSSLNPTNEQKKVDG